MRLIVQTLRHMQLISGCRIKIAVSILADDLGTLVLNISCVDFDSRFLYPLIITKSYFEAFVYII